jgi:hypothetical protein
MANERRGTGAIQCGGGNSTRETVMTNEKRGTGATQLWPMKGGEPVLPTVEAGTRRGKQS